MTEFGWNHVSVQLNNFYLFFLPGKQINRIVFETTFVCLFVVEPKDKALGYGSTDFHSLIYVHEFCAITKKIRP